LLEIGGKYLLKRPEEEGRKRGWGRTWCRFFHLHEEEGIEVLKEEFDPGALPTFQAVDLLIAPITGL